MRILVVVAVVSAAAILVTIVLPADLERIEATLAWLGGEDYLFAGQGVTLTVAPKDGRGKLGFDFVDEGRYDDGKWIAGRRLNGDETHQGRHVRLPPGEFGLQTFRLYRY